MNALQQLFLCVVICFFQIPTLTAQWKNVDNQSNVEKLSDSKGPAQGNQFLYEYPIVYTIHFQNTGNDTAFVLIRWVTSIGSINSFIENTSHTASTSRKNVVARFNSDNSAIYISLNYTSSRRISICKVNTSDLTNNIS